MNETLSNINFEIALEKIEKLTQHNNQLLDKIEELENKLKEDKNGWDTNTPPVNTKERFQKLSNAADAAMKRFTTKLRKELDDAKSKQSQRQSV